MAELDLVNQVRHYIIIMGTKQVNIASNVTLVHREACF